MGHPKVGIYLRLSRDDEREGESSSIENQRSYLKQYARGRDWDILREYADDGYSGLNFDRPQFQRMLRDIDGGVIDTVLTKDLSRLGRDQIFTAFYYQIYFPRKNVRYIAAAEGFDSAGTGADSALFPFLTAANDFYTADVSRKVRSALTARKREGKFVGSQPPFGYDKDPERPGGLVVDEGAAPVVREIFQRYLQSGSVTGVAKELTEGRVPTPAQYRRDGPGQERFSGTWNATTVRHILSNPTYAGHLTQNRRVKINYKIEKRRSLPREEWITVPNTHQPIVDQAQFDRAQELLALHSYRGERRGEGHLLTGLARCADCGSPMTYVREGPTRTYMVCQGYRKGGRLKLCTAHRVREDRVIRTIQGELRRLAGGLDLERLEAACLREEREEGDEGLSSRLRRQLERQKEVLGRLYEDRAAGLLREEEFLALFQQNRERRSALEEQLRQRGESVRRRENRGNAGEELERLLSFETLDRGEAAVLVEQVLVHQDKTIEISFRFPQPG